MHRALSFVFYLAILSATQSPAVADQVLETNGSWALPDSTPISYAILNITREHVEDGTTCDISLYMHDELVGNLQPGASIALNLPPGAATVRLHPNGPNALCNSGMASVKGQKLTLRAGEIRNYRVTLGVTGLYLAPIVDSY